MAISELWDRVDGRVFVQTPLTRKQFNLQGLEFTQLALQHLETSRHNCVANRSTERLPVSDSSIEIEEYVSKYFEEHVETMGHLECTLAWVRASAKIILLQLSIQPRSARFAIAVVNILSFWLLRMSWGAQVDLLLVCASSAPTKYIAEVFRLLISVFLHCGFVHILCNMLALIHFQRLEEHLGCVRFIVLYFAAGLWANLIACAIHTLSSWGMYGEAVYECGGLFNRNSNSMIAMLVRKFIGASGAVYGLLGADIAQGFIMWRILPGHWRWFLLKDVCKLLLNIYMESYDLSCFLQTPIAHDLHAAGFLAGFALACVLHRNDSCQLPSWIICVASAFLMVCICASCAIIFIFVKIVLQSCDDSAAVLLELCETLAQLRK